METDKQTHSFILAYATLQECRAVIEDFISIISTSTNFRFSCRVCKKKPTLHEKKTRRWLCAEHHTTYRLILDRIKTVEKQIEEVRENIHQLGARR